MPHDSHEREKGFLGVVNTGSVISTYYQSKYYLHSSLLLESYVKLMSVFQKR
jgi:hypothetical protein